MAATRDGKVRALAALPALSRARYRDLVALARVVEMGVMAAGEFLPAHNAGQWVTVVLSGVGVVSDGRVEPAFVGPGSRWLSPTRLDQPAPALRALTPMTLVFVDRRGWSDLLRRYPGLAPAPDARTKASGDGPTEAGTTARDGRPRRTDAAVEASVAAPAG